MKNKKQFKNRVVAVLCALVVAVSCIPCEPYFADSFSVRKERFEAILEEFSLPHIEMQEDLYYAVAYSGDLNKYVVCAISQNLHFGVFSRSGYSPFDNADAFGGVRVEAFVPADVEHHYYCYREPSNGKWTYEGSTSRVQSGMVAFGRSFESLDTLQILYSDVDVYYYYTKTKELAGVFYDSPYDGLNYDYNENIGYLQNVTRKITYIRGALYNYDEDSRTCHWSYSLQTNTGIDLTSGDYVVRHYVSWATVKGYEKKDIVDMTDKVLMAEYDASVGSFSYLDKDYEDKMYAYGFDSLNFFETVFKGYFVLEHSYFQIVNTVTNEVGGYLHFYPLDADASHFGVELEYEGLDDNFDEVVGSPSGNIKDNVGSGETLEDALENADAPKIDDLQGVDVFVDNLEAYSQEIKNVTSGLGVFLGEFPPWLLVLLGLSVAFPFVVVIIKSLR